MKLSYFLILLISTLLLSAASESQSPNPIPGPAKATEKEKQLRQDKTQITRKDNRPTEKPPPTIDLPTTPIVGKQDRDTSNNKEYPSSTNWWIAAFTGVLALAALMQLFVYGRQARYMRDGLKLTRQAADAASKGAGVAESSLKVVQRAWLAVVFDQPFQPQARPVTPIYFTVKNTGNTVAMLKQKKINAKRWEVSVIPDRQLEPKPSGVLSTIAVIFPGDKLMLDGLVDIPFTQTDIDSAITAPLLFDVYGYVAYDDVFGIRHITRFCQAYNSRTGGFDFPRETQIEYNDAD